MQFLKSLTDRRVFRYILAYGAGGWAVLEGVDTLADNGILPSWSYVAMFSLYLCGIPGALIVSWFHGAKGRQQVSGLERWLLAGVAVFALVTTGFFVRSDLQSREPSGVAGGPLAPHEDPARIAVLYFDPRGGEDASFLAPGLTASLIDALAPVNGLRVVSRSGSQLFRNARATPDSIGRALGAGTLVTGTVAQAGETVRVDVELSRSSTGEQFASVRLERPRSDIFALQDQLADTVATFLRHRLGSEVRARRLRAGTRSVEAWQKLQEAETHLSGAAVLIASEDMVGAMRAYDAADSLFAAAQRADPNWVEPITRRGWLAYRRSRLGGMDRGHYAHWIDAGLALADDALARDPGYASAHELRATLVYWKTLLNFVEPDRVHDVLNDVEAGLRRAIAASEVAASAHNTLSHLLMAKGRTAEAKLNALEAYEQDPFLENVNLTLWRIFQASWSLEDAVEANRYCQEGARRFPADFRFRQCALMLFALPGQTPDIRRAWQLADEFTELSPPQVREVNRQRGRTYVAMALARAGLPDSVRSVLRNTHASAELDPLREIPWLASMPLSWIGDTEEAVRQLSLYLAANPADLARYRDHAEHGEVPWFHRALVQDARFRAFAGLR